MLNDSRSKFLFFVASYAQVAALSRPVTTDSSVYTAWETLQEARFAAADDDHMRQVAGREEEAAYKHVTHYMGMR